MDFLDLRYLIACAEMSNIRRAAETLGLNASTVSRRMGRFEHELGLTLFERSHAGIRLTSGGAAIVVHARRALAEIDAMKFAGARNGSACVGQIHLGVRIAPIGDPIQGLLADWRISYPEVRITIIELSDHDIASALEDRRIDIALLPSFMLWPHAMALPLYHEEVVAALPRGHPLAEGKNLSWMDLLNETILVQGWDDSQAQRDFFASLLGSGARFHVHAASKLSVFALVEAGYGITLAARSQSELKLPGLVFRPIAEPDARFRIDLVWMPEMEEPAIGRFLAFMRDEMRSRHLL